MKGDDVEMVLRLREVVDADSRSDQAISLAAGCGRNYLRQVFIERKTPSYTKLLKILEQLGATATIYVLTGMQLRDLDLEFLEVIQRVPDKSKLHALELLRGLQDPKE
ncbi:MAG: transcriptional regulator [Pseudomonadota bacterium]